MTLPLSVTVVENFNPSKMYFDKFHIYVHNTYTIITNINSESLFKILLKLCKKLHLANYDITISPLQIRNTIPYTLKGLCMYR